MKKNLIPHCERLAQVGKKMSIPNLSVPLFIIILMKMQFESKFLHDVLAFKYKFDKSFLASEARRKFRILTSQICR